MKRVPEQNNGASRWRQSPAGNNSRADASAVMGVSAHTSLMRKESLYSDARDRAIATGDTRPDMTSLAAMEDHAEAMAREQDGAPFDPERNIHDREKLERNERVKKALAETEGKVAASNEDVRKRRDAAADQSHPPEKPPFPLLVFFFASSTEPVGEFGLR